MPPVMFNLETLRIALIGQGKKLLARETKLREVGAQQLVVSSYQLSERYDFSKFDVVMIVDLDEETSGKLYTQAKAARCLVNVEDNKKYCDFFFQSFVKRGKLIIGVSTNGSSPATAKLVRDKIEETFPPIWEEYIDEIAQKRIEWKAAGLNYDEVNQKTKDYAKKWL